MTAAKQPARVPAAKKAIASGSALSTDTLVDQWRGERPDLDMRAFGLTLRITGLALLIGQFGEKVAKQLGLKYGEMLLLHALRREGAPFVLRPTDILKLLKVTSGTVTYRIDRLESMGIVKRVADPQDRRSMLVQLTKAGIARIDKAVELTVAQASLDLADLVRDDAVLMQITDSLRLINAAYDNTMTSSENPLIHDSVARKKSGR